MAAVTRRRRVEREAVNDIEDQEETAPRRRRSQRDEEPTRRGRRSEPVHSDDDEEDEDAPRSRRRTKADDEPKKSRRVAKSGWGSVEEAKKNNPAGGGDFVKDLKLENGEEILIKFLEEEPFDVYYQHWVVRKGKQSATCSEENCPLCEVGDKPSTQVCFNVISLEDPDNPELFRWRVGVKLAETLEDFAKDKKTSPINREDLYFAVKRTKKKDTYNTTIVPVKARDLDEDWDMDPLTEEQIDELAEGAYDVESTEDTPMRILNEMADYLADA